MLNFVSSIYIFWLCIAHKIVESFFDLNLLPMKKIFTMLMFSWLSSSCVAQLAGTVDYVLSLPQQSMANHITAVHQFGISGQYTLPNYLQFLSIGGEIGIGSYANLRVPTTFSFGNGNPTSTYINYNSDVFHANVFATVSWRNKSAFTPYLTLKTGRYFLESSILVEDPKDIDGCRPLESETLLEDKTHSITYGGGLRFELPSRVLTHANKHYIDLQVTRTIGGTVDYINTRQLQHVNHQMPVTTQDDGYLRPLEMKFINVQSNVVHEHRIAEVYSTPLMLLQIKLGYMIEF
jgi:hypothetical protein